MTSPITPLSRAYFRRRPLDILALADELEFPASIVDNKKMNILPDIDTPQISTACGRGARSSFRMLAHELEECVLVLSIGETIKEVQDTGFLSSAPTLDVQQIDADALLQVHPQGIRHVLSDRRVNEWRVLGLVYFELDLDGQLNEHQERKAMRSTVLALSVAEGQ